MATRWDDLADKAYREAYADSALDSLIATQLRVLREQRDLTQTQLAEISGMKQSRISTLEDVNYSRWSLSTLKRLARAFDLALVVKFESFSGMLREMDRYGRDYLQQPSFTDDRREAEVAGADPAIAPISTGQPQVSTSNTGSARVLRFFPRVFSQTLEDTSSGEAELPVILEAVL